MAAPASIRDAVALQEKIGAGAFASVYRAQDRTTGKTVAVKRVRLDDRHCDLEACRREVTLLNRLDSPFVVKIFGAHVTGLQLWVIMEHMAVGSCEDLLASTGKFAEPALARILYCTVQGLAYLHAAGQVHRDIKPANILVGPTGDVKLCDLGVSFDLINDAQSGTAAAAAAAADGTGAGQGGAGPGVAASGGGGGDAGAADGPSGDARSWLPQSKKKRSSGADGVDLDSFTGTPKYMAPEVVGQQGNTPLSDVWSLGISTIEMATGVCPRSDVNPLRAMVLTRQEPAPVLDPAGGHSKTLADFVSRCLQKNPADRSTAAALTGHKLVKGKPKGSKLKRLIDAHMAHVERKGFDSGSSDEETADGPDDFFEWTFS